ncbi:MAG: MlaD family protein, partial [Pirellula sp.]
MGYHDKAAGYYAPFGASMQERWRVELRLRGSKTSPIDRPSIGSERIAPFLRSLLAMTDDPHSQSSPIAPNPNSLPATQEAADPFASLPQSVPVPRRRGSPSSLWWVTAACALVSLFLFYSNYSQQGSLIEVEFDQGHGLQVNDSVRFRGIEVGRVEKIGLASENPGILTSIRLTPEARRVVTDGTEFWIVRPVVSIDAVRGLETIVGPKYIALEPGKTTTYKTVRFQGLLAPPPILPKEGSVEIILDAKKRYGLESGAPVLHRGFHVGDILSVGLASDARSVIVRCAIDPEYHELVRSNSK